jgi:hypothetical protein
VPALYSYLSSKKKNITFEELIEGKSEPVAHSTLETV